MKKTRLKKPRRAKRSRTRRPAVEAVPVTDAELRQLRRELERRLQRSTKTTTPRPRTARSRKPPPARWNPEPEDVQKSVAQLVLTIVEFLRKLMERQAIRRMEQNTLTAAEVEAVGAALMQLEKTVRDIGKRFGLEPEDLNLDLGPVKLV